MRPEEEVEKMKALCRQVVNEKDPVKFSALLEELDALLKTTQDQLGGSIRPYPKSVVD